ncbi:MAG: hypothetical protein KDI33_10475 [Halioglobus sp.]|nr:hypothetical protein [Halioglobus sp.]
MKFSALFTAPLAYMPFSTPATEKREKTAKTAPAPVKRSRSAKVKKPAELKPYRGISIVFEDCACEAVKKIGSKRFLLSDDDAPMLPLPACDAARCDCKYKHHDDRREEEHDRRFSSTLRTDLYEDSGKENRRAGKRRGRRKSDT